MRLDLAPTPMAPVAKKRKWLMYEMLRYKEGLSRMVTLKVLIGVGVACLIFSQLSFWLGMAVLWGGLLLLDYGFHLIHVVLYAQFYMDLTAICFADGAEVEQDLRLLLNRAQNYLENKDPEKREALYKSLDEMYILVRTKNELREAIHDLNKGEVSQEVQTQTKVGGPSDDCESKP